MSAVVRALRFARAHARRIVLGGVLLILAGVLGTCSPTASQLEQVQARGVLRMATVNSPTTYYQGRDGPTGFEYDLAAQFAAHLGVELEVVLATTPPETFKLINRAEADFAAAGLGVSALRRALYHFTPPLLTVKPQLVYRMGRRRPKTLAHLDGRLVVVKGSVPAELLASLRDDFPDLQWEETAEQESEALLHAVAEGELDYTIAYSDIVAINQRYYPQLRVAFALEDETPLAWAFSRLGDSSLFDAADAFIERLDADDIAILHDRHFGHIEELDYVSSVALAKHAENRLPRYRRHFEEAGRVHEIDWRLLAAMGYQESHWDPDAVSPTGVRGIMMLTLATADFLGVTDREDPRQSIEGGARYFRRLLDQIPEVPLPDRYWMALAGYNMGLGHLIDARALTVQRGGDPTRWLDVRESLPLLTQQRWHKQTRYGYARGFEALHYVANVRTFYDMLVWITEGRPTAGGDTTEAVDDVLPDTPDLAPAPTPRPELNPLDINPPLL